MKTKLTLNLPVQVIEKSKTNARRRTVTVSALVKQPHAEQSGFSARWAGRFTIPATHDKALRLAHLLRKHAK